WFYLKGTDEALLQKRLSKQRLIHDQLLNRDLKVRVGQALEITLYRALTDAKDIPVVGRFLDLGAHDDSKLYKKEEPPTGIGQQITLSNERLDFVIFDRNN